jgi:redox-sensitive bicupin YhaK (pirin superfamily)
MHGMQAWIALPNELEETDPGFWHHEGDDLPAFESGGLWARMVAGSAFGAEAKVRTSSPMFYIHWELQPGTKTAPPAEHRERALYVAAGIVEIDGREFRQGR